ncbi:alpha-amylase family glycosyl hydrolase [Ferrimicrobium sp.]|uniref:alpha-amylase family glycosyl hydrolase n=1 Tax=Ferrimicrobium sp. TaxID=2926050 RepID=UPI002633142F|nr:alpha-amylase family glycosyl hydrolase [Ferrimicrobium sp.]
MSRSPDPNWLGNATIYQIYVRSFADADGDGNGDIDGVVEHLPYIKSLGVDAIWLSPIMPSPNHDWGYDVSDYYSVASDYGGMPALRRLIEQTSQLSLKVILDLIPNHTSSEHPWFVSARSNVESPYRDYYVWADPSDDGGVPNNWLDATGSSAWTYDSNSQQYFLHNFLSTQPDLNWWNPKVQEEFQNILRFWFDRGIDGFRVDVAHGIFKDRLLRDDPAAPTTDASPFTHFGLLETYSKNRPEVHALFRNWRQLAATYQPPKLLIGETWVGDVDRMIRFYGNNDELDLAMNFPFTFADFQARTIAPLITETLGKLPAGAYGCWAASNHDISRFPTRWCNDDEARVRSALMLLATLPGTLILYYGDELGLGDSVLENQMLRDEITAQTSVGFKRDYARTPMPWNNDPKHGFTQGNPWLPFGQVTTSVETQQADEHSILNLTRKLLSIRRENVSSPLVTCLLDELAWSYRVGQLEVHINFSDQRVQHPTSAGILIDSRGSERPVPEGRNTLEPFDAFIIRSS